MALQLSGETERVPYKSFKGPIYEQMPKLIEEGYDPVSIAEIIERRETAPKDVIEAWRSYPLWSGDSIGHDSTGGVLLTLDAQPLRELPLEKSDLTAGFLILDPGEWDVLKNCPTSLYLTAEEVKQADGKGYILRDGMFVPANKAVAKVWDHLRRGRDVQSYAKMVSEISRSNDVMKVCLFNCGERNISRFGCFYEEIKDAWSHHSISDKLTEDSLLVLSLALGNFELGGSLINGVTNLIGWDARLAGRIARRVPIAHEQAPLDARVRTALETGRAFEFNGTLYAPIKISSGLSLK